MTIKEIEMLSGMTRANIRFYETEGLLLPVRSSNGYRDYSEDDMEILKRIKLLRTLDISLEEIKLLHTGKQQLNELLSDHLEKLESDRIDIENSQKICKAMCSDKAQYQTLDAQHYLDEIESLTQKPVPEPEPDYVMVAISPWRRFFARSLDFALYSVLWNMFCAVVLNVNMGNRSLGESFLDVIVVMLLMIFIEPAMLLLFGTTVGKWVLGMRVTDNNCQRLTYSEALHRTLKVLWCGMGFNIPIYCLVRQWKSYRACKNWETLDWEYESTITLKDESAWRIWGYVAIHAAMFGVLFLALSVAEMPKHQGDITVAEFCENYNKLSEYLGIDTTSYLDETGKWAEEESLNNGVVMPAYSEPTYVFTEKDGKMTQMQFTTSLHNSNEWPQSYQNEMLLSIMSFVRAQKECNPLSKEVKDIVRQISVSPFEDFQFDIYGVTLTCDVEYSARD